MARIGGKSGVSFTLSSHSVGHVMKVTDTKLRNAKPQDKAYKIQIGENTYLEVMPSGYKVWRMRFLNPDTGKDSKFTLGEYPAISQPQARALAAEAKKQVKAGFSPVERRKAQARQNQQEQQAALRAQANSFESVARAWHASRFATMGKWKVGHAEKIMRQLEQDAFPCLGAIPVAEVTAPLLLEVLSKVLERGAVESAKKLYQRISSILSYAAVRKLVMHNEAANLKEELPTAVRQHNPYLKPEQIRPFLVDLERDESSEIIKLAILFTLHTLARTGETRFARWEEFDLEKRLWHVPAERMKMGRAHTVPLSAQVVVLLERLKLHTQRGYLFVPRGQGKPISENGMLQALYRMGYKGKLTIHGLRATGSTILNTVGWRGEVIESALAHSEKDLIRAAYNHSDYLEERRELMQWWSDHLTALEQGAQIIPIRHSRGA